MQAKTQAPDGWQVVRLMDVATMSQGGTPRKNRLAYWNGHIPFVTGADLSSFRIGRRNARSFLTTEGLHSGDTVVCNPGDLLLATRTRVGLTGIASETIGASQDITRLISNGRVRSEYLCRVLMQIAPSLQRRSRGTTIQGIPRKDVASFPILLPPLPEQHAIATALASIDEAIERTEEVIAATERLRDALLHELLTCGCPGWHTEWRDVPGVGTMPANWQVVRLGDVVEVNRDQWDPVDDVSILYLDLTSVIEPGRLSRPREIAAEKAPSRARRQVHCGDILVSMVRPYLRGFAHVRKAPCNLVASTGFAVLTPRSDVEGSLIYYHVMTRKFVRYLESTMTGQAYPSVRPDDVSSYRLALPPRPEQHVITTMLSNIDRVTKRARTEWSSLQSLKVSAADALLTGRVRIGTIAQVGL